MASLTECRMRSPFLCAFCQYLLVVFDMILSLFLSTFFIHHANYGLSAVWLSIVYSASCTGKESLTFLTWFQFEPPYFQYMQTSHPLVVSLLLLFQLDIWIKASPSLICVLPIRESMMAPNNAKHCPSWSIWANKLLDIALAVIAVLYPSEYSTLYILVSRIGLSDVIPIGIPCIFFYPVDSCKFRPIVVPI